MATYKWEKYSTFTSIHYEATDDILERMEGRGGSSVKVSNLLNITEFRQIGLLDETTVRMDHMDSYKYFYNYDTGNIDRFVGLRQPKNLYKATGYKQITKYVSETIKQSFLGYVTSQIRDEFPDDGIKDSYWYIYVGISNSDPSLPLITIPESIQGGSSAKISWTASTDPDNNLAGYILERKFDSNSWTQIYKGANRSYTDPIPLDKYKTVTYRVKAYDTENAQSSYATSVTRTIQNSTVLQFRLKTPIESQNRAIYGQETMTYTIPSGATFKAEACNNGFDENPTWEDITEFVKKQKIFEFANKTKTASKWGYDIRVTVDRNGATGDCYFIRGNGFFEEADYTPPPFELIPGLGQTILLFGYNWLVCHDDGTNKYLITNDVLKTVQWNTTDTTTGGYAASQIKKECDVISTNINANWYTQLVDTGNGKVFIPTYDQMNGGFSWFDSDEKRIAYLNGVTPYYWTATPAQSDRIWVVTNDGGFNYGYNPPTSNNGFRPAICVKYK